MLEQRVQQKVYKGAVEMVRTFRNTEVLFNYVQEFQTCGLNNAKWEKIATPPS